MSFYILFAIFFISLGIALSFAYSKSRFGERFFGECSCKDNHESEFKKRLSHKKIKSRGRRTRVDEEEIAAHSKIMELKIPPPIVEHVEAVPTKNDPKPLP